MFRAAAVQPFISASNTLRPAASATHESCSRCGSGAARCAGKRRPFAVLWGAGNMLLLKHRGCAASRTRMQCCAMRSRHRSSGIAARRAKAVHHHSALDPFTAARAGTTQNLIADIKFARTQALAPSCRQALASVIGSWWCRRLPTLSR